MNTRITYLVVTTTIILVIYLILLSMVGNPAIEEPEIDSTHDKLVSLGYVDWSDPIADTDRDSGVIYHDARVAYDGVNVYISDEKDYITFMDNDGRILHLMNISEENSGLVKPTPDGSLIQILKNKGLQKINLSYHTIWLTPGMFHHDFWILEDGSSYAIASIENNLSFNEGEVPITDDVIHYLDEEGNIKDTIVLSDLLSGFIGYPKLERLAKVWEKYSQDQTEKFKKSLIVQKDVFHTNNVEVLSKDIGVAKRGDLLISSQKLDLVAIINPIEKKLLWSWGNGTLDGPHNPSLLENGNILIFDNGYFRKYSRIIEVNPRNDSIVWEYVADPPQKFFSRTRGASQMLPNGNILITESNMGRAFEITRGGDIVWEFKNPILNDEKDRRRPISRLTRYPKSIFKIW